MAFNAWLNKENITHQGMWLPVQQIFLNSDMSTQAFMEITERYVRYLYMYTNRHTYNCIDHTHTHNVHDINCAS